MLCTNNKKALKNRETAVISQKKAVTIIDCNGLLFIGKKRKKHTEK
jgi:hypothetical protein